MESQGISLGGASSDPKIRAGTLDTIEKRINGYGVGHLLDALPTANSLTWTPYVGAIPATALVIGVLGDRHVLAFLTRFGDKAREVRYCTRAIHGDRTSVTPQNQTEVMDLPLVAPFKHLVDSSKPGKRKFSMLIRWYFLLRGLIDTIECEYDDYCKRFQAALRKIDGEKEAERTGAQDISKRKSHSVAESPEPDEVGNVYSLRSVSHNDSSRRVEDTMKDSPSKEINRSAKKKGKSDFETLRQYLQAYDALYLLENIPDADEVQFVDQARIATAQPKKLFIGTHVSMKSDIYAYMVSLPRGFHAIRIEVEGSGGSNRTITAEEAGKQRLLHPFSNTVPKQPSYIDQGDRARLTLMVKWYFIAAGIAADCVLKETKDYPVRLRQALDYIAERMGLAAVKPPHLHRDKDSTKPETSSASSYVDESDIQSTLAGDPSHPLPPPKVSRKPLIARKSAPSANAPRRQTLPSSSTAKAATSDATPTPNVAATTQPRSATKRTAEDAEFDELTDMLLRNQELTEKLNDLDHDLELSEMRKQTFLEKWAKEHDEMQKKRDHLDQERRSVRDGVKKLKWST
jgi:hypothetical protein